MQSLRLRHLISSPEGREAIVRRIVQRLVDAHDPVRIYLFGSRARGDWDEDSDFDFLLVMPDSVGASGRDYVAAYEPLIGITVSCDVVPCLESDVEAAEGAPASIIARALAEGRLVYERS